jgi:hypothetical protein
MVAALTNVFGDELEVLGECSSCSAPYTRPLGTKEGPSIFHAAGCTRTGIPFGGHLETMMVIEQSKARDAAQSAAGNHRINNASPLRQRKR